MTELLRPTRADPATPSPPLRVGLVCPYSMSVPGGVQNHVLGLAGHLSAAGDRVAILAPGRLDPARAREHGLVPAQITSAGPASPVPYNGSVARVGLGPLVAGRLRRWSAAGEFDLLHIHEPLAPGVSLLALAGADVPVVATFHTATPRSRLMRLAGTVFRSAVASIDVGIAVSGPARQVVVDHLDHRPQIIPNGIRTADFTVAPAPGGGPWRAGDRPRLVFLGRLDEPRKGLDVLLAALPAIRRRRPDLEVVVAGQGRVSRVRRRLPRDCLALGEIDDSARADLLGSADLFVAPHLDRESFGIVLLEAIAAGATVVASDLPAFTELLTGERGRLGFVFPAGDAAGLARTVDRALTVDRHQVNLRARAAVQRYDWSRVGPEVRAVYAAVVRR